MSFTPKTQPFSGKINAVTLGTGDKAIVIGGQNVLPFYTFDAPIENAPKIGIEVSDCSRRGIQAAARVAEIVEEMNLKPGVMGLIVNRAPGGVLDAGVQEEIEKRGLKLLGVLPQDDSVYRCDCDGEPSAKLPESDPMKTALKGIMQTIGL